MSRPSSQRDAALSAVACRRSRSPMVAPSEAALVAGFAAWLVPGGGPDGLEVDGPDQPTVPLTTALGWLCTSRMPLAGDAAAMLGLKVGATVGAAAAELLLAVHDPAGPRCASYPEAASYLRVLHRDEFDPTAPAAPAVAAPISAPPGDASAWLAAYALGLVYSSEGERERLQDLLHMVGERAEVLEAALHRLRTVELADPTVRAEALSLCAHALWVHCRGGGQDHRRSASDRPGDAAVPAVGIPPEGREEERAG